MQTNTDVIALLFFPWYQCGQAKQCLCLYVKVKEIQAITPASKTPFHWLPFMKERPGPNGNNARDDTTKDQII
jgi:hypothetical protein